MITLDADSRAKLAQLKRDIKALESPVKALRQAKRERQDALARDGRQREPRVREPGYLAFLRRQPCIAGLIEGGCSGPVQAAHLRMTIGGKRNPGMGAKPDDQYACALCEHHHLHDQHRGSEAAFWARLGINPLELCAALHAAYLAGSDGTIAVRTFARRGTIAFGMEATQAKTPNPRLTLRSAICKPPSRKALTMPTDNPILDAVPRIFLDCDGVLADFDRHGEAYFGMPPRAAEAALGAKEFWRQLEARGDFYRSMPLMADAQALVDGVKHLSPTILTGCPRGDWAQGQKVAWAADHFPGVPIITCRSADKRDHARAGDVLIDDWPQHRHRWIEMGGVFISHFDANTSLAALWAHYPELKA